MAKRAPFAVETRFDWPRFVERYWEQRPVLFRANAAAPFELAETFEAATAAGRTHLQRSYSGSARPNIQFTAERLQQVFLRPWLPVPADGSLLGYRERVARRLGSQRYALVISTFHSFSFPLWSRARQFFAGLWEQVGIPLTGAITTLFHGNYEHTPSGVHRDRFTTFLFALQGRKRMRFWPARPWSEPVSTLIDYRPYLDRSFSVDVEPGDLLYWPASYYHVGEGVGDDVATSINIGVPRTEHRTVYTLDDLLLGTIDESDLADQDRARSRLARVNGTPLMRGILDGGRLSSALPAPLQRAVRAFRDVTRPRETAQHIRTLWLGRTTATGFEPVPAPAREPRLTDEHRVRADPQFPIQWTRAATGRRSGEWLCSANGHVVRVAGHAGLPRLLATLNTGRPARVADLLRRFRTSPTPARTDPLPATRVGIKRLLEKLCAFRALTVERAKLRSE